MDYHDACLDRGGVTREEPARDRGSSGKTGARARLLSYCPEGCLKSNTIGLAEKNRFRPHAFYTLLLLRVGIYWVQES